MYALQPSSITTAHSSRESGYQFQTPVLKLLDMRDFNDVKELGNSTFPDMHYPDTYWSEMLCDQTDVICIGCRDGSNGNLLGLITVAPDGFSFLHSSQRRGDVAMLFNYYGTCAYITSLCVHPAYRKMGFARQLIGKAIEELRCMKNPASLLFLHVARDNADAIRFYRRTGFSHYTTLRRYYRSRASHLSRTALVYTMNLCDGGCDERVR